MPVIGKGVLEMHWSILLSLILFFMKISFGFVKNGCSVKALFAFRDIADYFRERRSKVLRCSLGVSKAFDRINHHAPVMGNFNC